MWLQRRLRRWKQGTQLAELLRPTLGSETLSPAAFSELERLLQRPELRIRSVRRLTRASRVFLVETRDRLQLVWKAGEVQAAREEAAYRLDRRLTHVGLVPPVVSRELNGTRGALRFFLGQARPAYLDPRSSYVLQTPERENYYRLALLDCLLGNRDRHAGNWLLTPAGVVIPIDHGMTFPRRNGPQRFAAYDFHLPVTLRAEQRDRLETMVSDWESVRAELLGLVGEEAVNALWERVQGVLKRNATFDWHSGANLRGAPRVMVRDSFEATFGSRTGLDSTHPTHGIHLSEPDDYAVLLEHIEVHRYYVGQERQAELSLQEAAASWFESVYQPVQQAIESAGLAREFPRSTRADLYLWLTYHRERIKAEKGWMPSDRFVALHLADRFSGRPWPRIWKTFKRGVRAAFEAARETPKPPAMRSGSSGVVAEQAGETAPEL